MDLRTAILAAALAVIASGLAGCDGEGGIGFGCRNPSVVQAVRDNDVLAVLEYLDGGGDADATSCDGDSLVYIATGPRGGTDVLSALLDVGADPDKRSEEGRTPLMNAAGWCDLAAVTMLLQAGADPAVEAPGGRSALSSVCYEPADRRAATLELIETALGG